MSDNFCLQLSVKIDGTHLLNIRSEGAEEFGTLLKWSVENAEQIQTACRALEGKAPAPVFTPRPAPIAVPGASSQGGDTVKLITGVDIKTGPREGPPFKSPMYVVSFGDRSSASTFDELDGKALLGLVGKQAHIGLVAAKNPKYTNIIKGSVRSAS